MKLVIILAYTLYYLFQLQVILAIGATKSSYFCEDENVWKTSTIPPAERQHTSAIAIHDNLYIIGAGRSFCQYDPGTNKWIKLPSMQMNRTNLTTAFHGDYLYVVDTTKCAERYNFTSRRWQYISCLPFTFEIRPSAIVYRDKIIVVGTIKAGEMKMVSFDPQTNSWTEIGTMTRKGVQKVQVVVVEQKLYSVQTGRSQDEIGWYPRSVVTRHEPPVLENECVESTTKELEENGSDSNESFERDLQSDYAQMPQTFVFKARPVAPQFVVRRSPKAFQAGNQPFLDTRIEEKESDSNKSCEEEQLEYTQKVVPQKFTGRGTIPSFQIGNQLFLVINDYIHNTEITLEENRVYNPDLCDWSQLGEVDSTASLVHFAFWVDS